MNDPVSGSDHFMVKAAMGHLPPFAFHLSPPPLYTSTLYLQDDLIVICHAVLVLSENANIKRSKRSLKRRDVTGDAKRKSLLELLTNNGPKRVKRKDRLRLKGSQQKRDVKWHQRWSDTN